MEKHCFDCDFCDFELDDNLEYKLICNNMLSNKYIINESDVCDFYKNVKSINKEPLHEKKEFVINSNVTISKLEEVGFKKGGWINGVNEPRYYINDNILDEIDIHIEISIVDNNINFDDLKNVYIIDENFGQPYTPFYESEFGFKFLNNVIDNYNKYMNNLVNKGILQEKIKEKDLVKKLIK